MPTKLILIQTKHRIIIRYEKTKNLKFKYGTIIKNICIYISDLRCDYLCRERM